MKLFISNATKHVQEFAYRIPENIKLFQQSIPVGGQVQIYQDTTSDILEGIIAQHQDCPKPFLIPVSEVSRHRDYAGLIYSFDKPVSSDRTEGAMEQNSQSLIDLGLEQRKEAAAALDQRIGENAQVLGAGVNSVEVSVYEESKRGEKSDSGKINETIKVSK